MASIRHPPLPRLRDGHRANAVGACLTLAVLLPPAGLTQDTTHIALPAPDSAASSPGGRLGTLVAVPPIVVGARLRVRHHRILGARGTVVALRGDTVALRTGVLPLVRRFALDEGHRVEVSIGRGSRVRGAALGGVAGAAGSVVLAAGFVHAFGGSVFGRDADTVRDAAGLILPYGVGIGAVMGALMPGDRWQRVRLRPVEHDPRS